MSRGSTHFLRLVILGIGVAVGVFCAYVLPMGIMTDETGYYRPILFFMYLPAVPFYFALYQGLLLLDYIDNRNAFSDLAVKALRKIKYGAAVIAGLYVLAMPLIFSAGDKDDAPGVILIGLVIIFANGVVATFAALLQALLSKAIEIKSENELTV